MNTIDKDIDEMQSIIENICPSCHKIGRAESAHDSWNARYDCIRYFKKLCHIRSASLSNGIVSLTSNAVSELGFGKWEYKCCESDFEVLTVWIKAHKMMKHKENIVWP